MPDHRGTGAVALALALALGWLAAAGPVTAAPPEDSEIAPSLRRLDSREQTLVENARAAEVKARVQAREAYRLARRRQLGFVGEPARRLDDARALDLALVSLRRSVGEARAWQAELARVREDRQQLDEALVREGRDDPRARPPFRFLRPVRGTVVGEPGQRADAEKGSAVELRHQGLEILARMNEPVYAPAFGVVRRVDPLPQGGFGLVLEHDAGWLTLISGLREVTVSPGATVERGAPLALAGRNLDGAPVVKLELWRGRAPADPHPLLGSR